MTCEQLQYLPGTEGLILDKLRQNKPGNIFCLVVDADEKIDQHIEIIKFFNPKSKIIKFPAWDTTFYDRVSPSARVMVERLSALKAIEETKNNLVVVTSISALFHKIMPRSLLSNKSMILKPGDKISHSYVQSCLVEIGYNRLINAINPGEFASRGGIIDIVIKANGLGYRLDFFGQTLESIKAFNTETQKSIKKIEELMLVPADEVILNNETIAAFKKQYLSLFGVTNDPLFEAITSNRKFAGYEFWMPLFYEEINIFFDYLPLDVIFILPYNFETRLEDIWQNIVQQYDVRLQQQHRTKESYYPVNPENLYIEPKKLSTYLKSFSVNILSPFASSYESSSINLKPIVNLKTTSLRQKQTNFATFKDTLMQNTQKKTLVACYSNGSLSRVQGILREYGIIAQEIKDYTELYLLTNQVVGIAVCPIDEGFEYADLLVFSEADLVGEKLAKVIKKRSISTNILEELNAFSEGDLIVHIEHGIGRFQGLETLTVQNTPHDFVKILYAGNDKLFLPVENLELISSYGSGEDAPLDKLGGTAWQFRKAKLKNKIKLAAERLVNTAALREVTRTEPLIPLADSYKEFCDRFPYVETEDQLRAINDIINDFASGKPVDRLICGDVGFGKTEVALRAAFLCAVGASPGQVAVLVPTTLLARQHYQTFKERFANLSINVKQLSKFTTSQETKQIKADLGAGKIDVVIGTHALLASDVRFKHLGLLIIDEEQHFGVGQKEKLKELKNNCHVLTLSATPIPRTLQMSLTGVKDLSLIATPPLNRLPVSTFVMPFDHVTIRQVILREFYRGGRVFYVTPRVSYINSIIETLNEIVPEIKVAKAHGQMSAVQLDQIMNDFFDGKYQVLVSTTIVESGLDIPMANTVIIDRADMFGLAQLYQIRGRVGRTNIQAYAYLTYPHGKHISQVAEKRLTIIQSLSSLGSGFSVASHDMDLRGYGNLVGEEQSGHIKEIGIELYQHLLEEAIQNLKTHNPIEEHDWSPMINIGISVQIPASFIPDMSLRLSVYRRIASLSQKEEVEAFAAEMIDRFGPLPIEAQHLLSIVKIKQLAKIVNIEKIELGSKGLVLTFRNGVPKDYSKIMNFIKTNANEAKLRPEGKLFISKVLPSSELWVSWLENFLEALC